MWIEHGNRPSKEENTHVETLQGDVNSNAGSETWDGPIEKGELYIVFSNTDVDSRAESEPNGGQNTDGESHQQSLSVEVDWKNVEESENKDITKENSQENHKWKRWSSSWNLDSRFAIYKKSRSKYKIYSHASL